jgi:hypothetical protein
MIVEVADCSTRKWEQEFSLAAFAATINHSMLAPLAAMV